MAAVSVKRSILDRSFINVPVVFEFSGKLIYGKGLFKIQMRLKQMYHYIICFTKLYITF